MRPSRSLFQRVYGALLLGCLCAAPGVAQGCLEYVGSYDRGPAHGVDATADHVFVGSDRSLLVVDVLTDPQRPAIVGDVVLPSFIYSVAVQDDLAYVAADDLIVVDVSDPKAPQVAATFPEAGARHVHISNGLMVLSLANSRRFQFYDLSNPLSPALLSGINAFDFPHNATLQGSNAFLVDNDEVDIWDLSTPGSPQFLGDIQLPFGQDALPDGNLLYAIDRIEGLLIFDISDPGAPVQLGQLGTGNNFARYFSLQKLGQHLVLSSSDGSLQVVDVSVPASPQLVGQVADTGEGRYLDLQGDQVFVAQLDGGLAIFDVSDPTQPDSIGRLATAGRVQGIQVQGNTAYLAAGLGGVRLVDVSDPSLPQEISWYDTLGEAWDLQVAGDTVFVADGPRGLLTLSVSDPLIPRALDDIPSIGDARAVEVAEDLAYVAAWFSGLQIVDVSFPLLIEEVGELSQVDRSLDLELQGDVAYLADFNDGIRVVDVSNPAMPEQLGLRDTPGQAISLTLQDTRLMVGNDFQPVTLYDIQDPSQPQLLGSYDCDASEVLWHGNTAFMACRGSELRAVNVSQNHGFFEITSYEGIGNFTDLAVDGDLLYAGRALGGVDILDISGCDNLLIDGFESGDTSAWSAAVP